MSDLGSSLAHSPRVSGRSLGPAHPQLIWDGARTMYFLEALPPSADEVLQSMHRPRPVRMSFTRTHTTATTETSQYAHASMQAASFDWTA